MIADTWLAVAGIIAVATITPGPNNFIVLEAGVRGGLVAALPLIAAVIAGGLVLLALVWAGAGVMFDAEPRLRTLLTLAGSAWLIALGAGMVLGSARKLRTASQPSPALLPQAFVGVAFFQLVNPKAWVLMITATSATGLDDPMTFATLGGLFVLLSCSCLAIWTIAGSALGAVLARPRYRRRFDLLTGVLLVASAFALVVR